jgi:hypothetical protein
LPFDLVDFNIIKNKDKDKDKNKDEDKDDNNNNNNNSNNLTVPDRTLGGIYLLRVKILQLCKMVILLKFLIALGIVFIELGKQFPSGP